MSCFALRQSPLSGCASGLPSTGSPPIDCESPGRPRGAGEQQLLRGVGNLQRRAKLWMAGSVNVRFPFRYPPLLGHRFGAYPSPRGTRSSASLRALRVSVPPQNKFAQTAQNAEQISFGSLRKSRPSALGSRAHSRGFAMCAPSQFGSSKRRNRHVSEQNHAHRFPWQ